MSRHSKNNTAGSVFTYHERKKLKGVGTLVERLEGETMRRFEQCWLCFKEAANPVVNLQGCLFCRNCIILNLGEQKERMAAQKARWQKQQNLADNSGAAESERKRKEIEDFKKIESGLAPSASPSKRQRTSGTLPGPALVTDQHWKATSFWAPENTPSSRPQILEKPDTKLKCPITDQPMKAKELVAVFPEVDAATGQWLCAVTKKPLACRKASLVKPTGQLVADDCLDKLVIGNTGFHTEAITMADIIHLGAGGTAFSAHNTVEARVLRPVLG